MRRLFLLVLLLVPSLAFAETHTVRVIDHAFVPASLTIDEGDTVLWTWETDNHNVVAGVPFTKTGAFESPLANNGFTFQLVFNRQILNYFPAAGNVYDYYCQPHALMGMLGDITVNRTTTDFQTNLNGWQEVPQADTSATGDCTMELNDTHTSLSVSCNHNVANPTMAHIHFGSVGNTGSVLCGLSVDATTATGNCPLTPDDVEELFGSALYVNIHSTDFPAGEIRGQIVRTGGDQTVSGRVTYPNGAPFAGVTVSDGTNTEVSDALGNYSFANVPNGAYRVTADLAGFNFSGNMGVNPYVVNNNDVFNRNISMIALDYVTDSDCDGDDDGDGVCNFQEGIDLSNRLDAGSYRTHLESPLDVLWNGFIGLVNILELVNRGQVPMDLTLELYDISGVLQHSQDMSLAAGSQFDVIVNDLPGFQADTFGIVRIRFDQPYNDFIDGRMSFYRPSSIFGFEFAFSVPFESPLYGPSGVTFNTFQPSFNPFEVANQVAQWLSIVNLNETVEKSYRIRRFNQIGELLSDETVSVPPFGRRDLEAGHVNPGASQVGLHMIEPLDNSSPYLAQLFRYGGDAAAGEIPATYSFAFPISARAGNGEIQYVPISVQEGASNWLELANLLDVGVDANVELFDSNGVSLRTYDIALLPKGQMHIDVGSELASESFGLAVITPGTAGSIIGQNMHYFRDATGSIVAMYGLPIRESYGLQNFGSYNLFLTMESRLKIANVGTSGTNLTLNVFYAGGSYVESFLLNPNSTREFRLDDNITYMTSPDTYGVLRIDSFSRGLVISDLLRLRPSTVGSIDFASPTAVR